MANETKTDPAWWLKRIHAEVDLLRNIERDLWRLGDAFGTTGNHAIETEMHEMACGIGASTFAIEKTLNEYLSGEVDEGQRQIGNVLKALLHRTEVK